MIRLINRDKNKRVIGIDYLDGTVFFRRNIDKKATVFTNPTATIYRLGNPNYEERYYCTKTLDYIIPTPFKVNIPLKYYADIDHMIQCLAPMDLMES